VLVTFGSGLGKLKEISRGKLEAHPTAPSDLGGDQMKILHSDKKRQGQSLWDIGGLGGTETWNSVGLGGNSLKALLRKWNLRKMVKERESLKKAINQKGAEKELDGEIT